jgi:hypothetical protein
MSAIVIKADNQSNKILSELAKRLGADVITMDDDQFEDLMLGKHMDSVKTGEKISRDAIMQKLKSK